MGPTEPGQADHYNPAPMATARAGKSIRLMFGGNGHSRGDFGGVQKAGPGRVGVFWKGEPESEIVYVSEVIVLLVYNEDMRGREWANLGVYS